MPSQWYTSSTCDATTSVCVFTHCSASSLRRRLRISSSLWYAEAYTSCSAVMPVSGLTVSAGLDRFWSCSALLLPSCSCAAATASLTGVCRFKTSESSVSSSSSSAVLTCAAVTGAGAGAGGWPGTGVAAYCVCCVCPGGWPGTAAGAMPRLFWSSAIWSFFLSRRSCSLANSARTRSSPLAALNSSFC